MISASFSATDIDKILSVSRNLAIISKIYTGRYFSHESVRGYALLKHDLPRPVLPLKMFHFSHLLLSDSEMASNRRFGARVTRAGKYDGISMRNELLAP